MAPREEGGGTLAGNRSNFPVGVVGWLTLWLLDTLRDRSLAGEVREVELGRV